LTLSLSLVAQTSREREAREDLDYTSSSEERARDRGPGDFGSQLWWGTGAQLGFSATNNTSFFQIGLSPIVGYKINNILSVGPRGSLAYNSYKVEFFGGGEQKENFITWSAGAFARAKVFAPFFVHAEYSLVNEREQNFNTGELQPLTRAIPFLGGGISQGGGIGQAGFEILVLFRLSGADRINDSPFEFRSGFNFNF
ncbi:MAG: hypothetical protein AAGF89_07380, partial [Bacteroidota bacterium]